MREEGPLSNGEKKSDDDEVGMMMIPCLDFSFNNKNNNNGLGSLEEWKKMMSKKVREACEKHGYFVLVCDDDDDEIVPKVLREKMLMGLKELFDLPEETKMKHQSTTKPYSSYTSDCPVIPLNQSFGVCDSHVFHVSQEFTNLMWPHGNPSFCETMNSISSKLVELNYMILKMIEEGYELPKHYTWEIEDMLMKGTVFLRLMKYKSPSKEGEIGLVTHTDKNTLTILCQNDVQGLEVQTKTGKWIQVEIPQNAYVVVVGDILKAWSNGRLHAVRHRVTMKGDKERYSFGVFTMPKDEAKIEVPPELVDANTHPLRYHPFTYGDYIKFFVSNLNENALDEFAAL
ncbi:hypothetical protein HN51_017115 [Arachis hypogaea]